MNLIDYAKNLDKLRNIKRYQMECVINPQPLSDHSFHVANIFYFLVKILDVEITSEQLFLVLNHDFVECFTGDLNAAIKDKDDKTKEMWNTFEDYVTPEKFKHLRDESIEFLLGDYLYKLLKLSDMLEAYWYCCREYLLGNKAMINIAECYLKKIHKLLITKNYKKIYYYLMEEGLISEPEEE